MASPYYSLQDAWGIAAAAGGGILGKSTDDAGGGVGIRPGTGILAQVRPFGGGAQVNTNMSITVNAQGATPETVPLIAKHVEAAGQDLASHIEVAALQR